MVLQDLNRRACHKTMIAFATLLARTLVRLKWRDKSPSVFNLWIRDLMHHLILGKICYATRRCTLNFYTIWQPALNQVERVDP